MFTYVKISAVIKQYAIIITVNFSILFLGMEMAWTSPVLVKLQDLNQTSLTRPISDADSSWIASAVGIGGLPTMFFTGYLIDRLGRKRCILLSIIPRLIVCGLILFTREVWCLFLARVLCGMSEVMSLSVVPTYTSEISSKEIRGALGSVNQVLSNVGALIMLSVGPFVSYLSLNIIFTAIQIALSIPQMFLPESPYFLYVKGNHEESLKVLTSIRESEEIAREEMKEYSLNSNNCVRKQELLQDKTALKTIGKVIFLTVMFQMIGYNAIFVYLQTIFESTNTSLRSEFGSLIIGCIQLLASFCTIFLTDRVGRKPILTGTLAGMALGMIGLGAFFKLSENHIKVSGVMNYLPLVSLILVIFCFNAGLGSIIWMLIAELFEGPSRAIGVSCGVFFTTVFIFITTYFFNVVINAIGPAATYWMFAGNCIMTLLFVFFLIPETKGRSFSEIQQALGRTIKKPESQMSC